MDKKYMIWVFLLEYFLKNKKIPAQRYISKKLDVSLGLVNYALKEVKSFIIDRNFIDVKRFLTFLGIKRNIGKDIIGRFVCFSHPFTIEKKLPDVVFTGYSGYRFMFGESPVDYQNVYVYSNDSSLKLIEKTFKRVYNINEFHNIIVLKEPVELFKALMSEKLMKKNIAPISLIFSDVFLERSYISSKFIEKVIERLENI